VTAFVPAPLLVRRSAPEPRGNYRDYIPWLRHDFWYSCGYCSLSEAEAHGVGFHADHYLPRRWYPEQEADFQNLVYSCQKCNSWKADYEPEQSGPGRYFIRPDREDPRQHIGFDGVTLTWKTPTRAPGAAARGVPASEADRPGDSWTVRPYSPRGWVRR
jgi:hypothetical protein